MINTIFASHLIDSKGRFEPDEPVRQTTEIQAVSHSELFFLSLSLSGFGEFSRLVLFCSLRERRGEELAATTREMGDGRELISSRLFFGTRVQSSRRTMSNYD